MNQFLSTTGLTRLLTFPFRDPKWKTKFLIGFLVGITNAAVPILPYFFLYGYYMRIMRRIIVEKGEPYLPEWDQFDKMLLDGLKLFGVSMVYFMPVTILMVVGMIGFFGILAMFPMLIDQKLPPNGAKFFLIAIFLGIGAFLLTMFLSIIIGFFTQAALCHVVETGQFSAGFRIKEWWPVFQANLGGFLLAFGINLCISWVAMFFISLLYLTIILFPVVPYLMMGFMFYQMMIGIVLQSYAYAEGKERLAAKAQQQPALEASLPVE
jgi:hypothetical protein